MMGFNRNRYGYLLNVHLCVDGDGLLDTYYGSRKPIIVLVVTIFVWFIMLLPQHCEPFTHSVYTITKIDDYRVLPLVVVLAMPDHRPHAPYVGVPCGREDRLLWRLFIKADNRITKIGFLFYSW